MIGCSKEIIANYSKKAFKQRIEHTLIKINFNSGLALIILPTTGPRVEQVSITLSYNFNKKKLWSFLHQQFQAKLQHLQSALHQEGNHKYLESNLI